MNHDLPSRQLDELKTFLFSYIVLGPLLAALFADKIDNIFLACVLFVGITGSAFLWFKKRLQALEVSIKDLERRIEETELSAKSEVERRDF